MNDPNRIPFSPEDEAKIASAATWGTIVAVVSIIGGGLSLLTTALASKDIEAVDIGTAIGSAAFVLILNVILLQACQAFRKVATTDEADQAYLLDGFKKLNAYFTLQVVILCIVIALIILGLGVVFALG